MGIAIEIEMVLVESTDDLHIYEEMIDVESGERKLGKPMIVHRSAISGNPPEIVMLRIEVIPKPRPYLVSSHREAVLPPIVA